MILLKLYFKYIIYYILTTTITCIYQLFYFLKLLWFFILNFIWSILECYYIFVYTFLEKNIKRELKILHKIFLDAIIILSRCGAVGSARGLGPWGRRFEPCHLDHKIILKKLVKSSFFLLQGDKRVITITNI